MEPVPLTPANDNICQSGLNGLTAGGVEGLDTVRLLAMLHSLAYLLPAGSIGHCSEGLYTTVRLYSRMAIRFMLFC